MDVHWIALSLLPNVGGKTLQALIAHFGSTEAVLQADKQALVQVRGVGPKIAEAICAIDLAAVEEQIQQWSQQAVSLSLAAHPDYPAALKTVDDAPPTLFVRGIVQPQARAIAIVGTRSPGSEAQNIAFRLGKTLAEQGWIIVSGLALGIDSAAHQGALETTNGQTIAVLGSGVLNIYPEQNQALAEQIVQRGALLGENHPAATATAPRLVARNRIITGLCQHLIVVETEADGGAMYAARFALAQGRTLHAVGLPAGGNLQLLKERANYIAPDLQNLRLD